MGFFKRIKKAVKGVAKLAIKTAPIWTNFIPVGGSFVNTAVSKLGPMIDKAKQMKSRLPPRMRALVSKGVGISKQMGWQSPLGMSGPALRGTAAMSQLEEEAFESQGVAHAGIRGPVGMHWGPKWKGPAFGVSAASMGRMSGLRGGGAYRNTRRRRRSPTRGRRAPMRRRARPMARRRSPMGRYARRRVAA